MTKEALNSRPEVSKKISREELLDISSTAIQKINERLRAKRFREKTTDSTEMKYFRLLFQGLATHAQILKEEQMDDLIARLEALEEKL